jgi:hypothetical protein
MIKNVGVTDKIIRILIAIILVVLARVFNIWWLLLIAIIPFLTAFIDFCPLYLPFKINTTNKNNNKKKDKSMEINFKAKKTVKKSNKQN